MSLTSGTRLGQRITCHALTAALIAQLSGPMRALTADSQARAAGTPRDWTTFNVCQLVPGEAVAKAVAAKLNEARPFYDKTFSRCTYLVTLTATNRPTGYVVWMEPEANFEELKKEAQSPLSPIAGLGDGAYMFQDKGDGRFKLRVLKRGDLMFEATGDSAESARKVADVVVQYLWKKPAISIAPGPGQPRGLC